MRFNFPNSDSEVFAEDRGSEVEPQVSIRKFFEKFPREVEMVLHIGRVHHHRDGHGARASSGEDQNSVKFASRGILEKPWKAPVEGEGNVDFLDREIVLHAQRHADDRPSAATELG